MNKETAINETIKQVAWLEAQIEQFKNSLLKPSDNIDFDLVGFQSALQLTADCVEKLRKQI